MVKKVGNFILSLLKEYYKMIIFLIIFFIVVNYPVPYYVFTSGGITDLSDRFEITDSYEQEGSYNLSYVNQLDGNVLSYVLSGIMPGWDALEVEKYQYNSEETIAEMLIRDKLSLLNANQTAVMLAYYKADKEIKINNKTTYVYALYDFLDSDVKIKIGDILYKIEDVETNDVSYLVDLIQSKEVGDTISLEFKRNDTTYKTNVKINNISGVKLTGITFCYIYDYEVNPEINFKFKDSESGASAGLMTTLAIYDALIPEDLTNGLKIAGTGTIESDESVGEIGGIKYKLAAAERGKADIFFAPSGENYEEAIKLKKEKNYKIEVVEAISFDQAVNYLKSLKNN